MEITDTIKHTAAGTILGLSLLVSGCSAQDAPKNPSGKLHKDCYGMHIKEGKDITLEMYKEGWLVFKETIHKPVQFTITDSSIVYQGQGVRREYVLTHGGNPK